MRVLITGANGFVGSNVLKYLAKNTDWEFVTVDADLSKQFIQDKEGFDIILNLASNSSVEHSIKEPVEVIENNIMLTTKLLEYARFNQPKLFIQFSTVEADKITNPYAASKKAQEDICKAYRNTYGVPVVIFRSVNIIGQGQNPEKFVPKIIEQIKAQKPVTIYIDSGKIGSRYYVTAKNVAEALKHLIVSDLILEADYTMPAAVQLTNLGMAHLVAKVLDEKLVCEFIEAETVRPNYLSEYKYFPYLPGFSSIQTLEEGLRELVC